jgi:hypothetical protein
VVWVRCDTVGGGGVLRRGVGGVELWFVVRCGVIECGVVLCA